MDAQFLGHLAQAARVIGLAAVEVA